MSDEPRRVSVLAGAEAAGRRGELLAGVKAAGPILLGYVPAGVAYGLVARAAGLTPLEIVAMSIFVYAGSAQFVAVAMIASGAAPGALILTTLFINLRHVLFGASLARYLEETPLGARLLLSQGVTDETFVVSATQFAERAGTATRMAGTNLVAYLDWIGSSALGAFAGDHLGDVTRLGIEFALPAMFIGLVALQLKRRRYAAIGLAAAALGVLFRLWLGADWYLVATILAAPTLGVVMERWIEGS